MAYKSPIELICDDIQWHMEQETVKAVQHYFPLVDEEELFKALKYDRDQYAAGFVDGRAARDAEIVRCKDCKWFDMTDPCGTLAPNSHRCKRVARLWMEDDAFCAYGERRDDG